MSTERERTRGELNQIVMDKYDWEFYKLNDLGVSLMGDRKDYLQSDDSLVYYQIEHPSAVQVGFPTYRSAIAFVEVNIDVLNNKALSLGECFEVDIAKRAYGSKKTKKSDKPVMTWYGPKVEKITFGDWTLTNAEGTYFEALFSKTPPPATEAERIESEYFKRESIEDEKSTGK